MAVPWYSRPAMAQPRRLRLPAAKAQGLLGLTRRQMLTLIRDGFIQPAYGTLWTFEIGQLIDGYGRAIAAGAIAARRQQTKKDDKDVEPT